MDTIPLQQITSILSETLQQVVHQEISHKKATMIVKVATALSKNIANTELKERIELLESVIAQRR